MLNRAFKSKCNCDNVFPAKMNSITGVPSITNLFKTLPINPNIIIIVVVVIVGYIIFFGNLGSSKNSENLIN